MKTTLTALCGTRIHTFQRGAATLLLATPLWIALQGPVHAEPAGVVAVRGVTTQKVDSGRRVVIQTSGTPSFSTFKMTEPHRILVDLSGAELSGVKEQLAIGDGLIREVHVRAFKDQTSTMTRVEIVLDAEVEHTARADGSTVVVDLTPVRSAATPTAGLVTLGKLEKKVSKKGLVLSAKLGGTSPQASDVSIQQLSDPARIVVDVAGAVAQPKWQKLEVHAQGVERVRVGSQDGAVRFVLDLVGDATLPEVTVEAVKGRLELAVTPPAVVAPVVAAAQPAPAPVVAAAQPAPAPVVAAAQPAPAPVPVAPKAVEAARPEPVVAAAQRAEAVAPKAEVIAPKVEPVFQPAPAAQPVVAAAKTEPAKAKSLVRVEDVKFEPKAGFYRLSLTVAGDFNALTDATSTKLQPTVRIPAALLPESLIRTLDTTGVAGSIVGSVSTYREGDDVLVAAQVGAGTEHRQWRKGNTWFWDFRAKDGAQPETAQMQVMPERSVAGYQSTATRVGALAVGQRGAKYTGRRISLDLKDAEIQNVLRLLADVSQLNIVAGDNVIGKVTLKLKNVPWDQALDIVLQARNLDKVRSGNVIRVAPADVLEKEAQLRAQREESNQKLEPLSVRIVPVNYGIAAGLTQQVAALLSARGKVNVDPRTNVLIIEDIADVLVKVERMIRTLDTQTPQVMIEARIVQARTNLARSLGVQWGGQLAAAPEYGNGTGLSFPARIGVQGAASSQGLGIEGVTTALFTPGTAANTPVLVNLPGGAASGIGFTFGSANGAQLLSLRLTAEEQRGRAKIISSPRVVTLDNQQAKITSGERIPFTVVTANGPTTRFIDANLQLTVTPHITADGSILMKINASQNEISDRRDTFGTPGIFIREAETEMIVQDGDTAVLGGIYRRSQRDTTNVVPFLGDVPILGLLFRSTATSDERDELLIFISPRVVNRSEAGVGVGSTSGP